MNSIKFISTKAQISKIIAERPCLFLHSEALRKKTTGQKKVLYVKGFTNKTFNNLQSL